MLVQFCIAIASLFCYYIVNKLKTILNNVITNDNAEFIASLTPQQMGNLELDTQFPGDEIDGEDDYRYDEHELIGSDSGLATDALGGAESNDSDSISMEENFLFSNVNNNVTSSKMLAIENVLTVDEKVSLIYLLYENVIEAQNQIKDLLLDSTSKPIYEWVLANEGNEIYWRRSLIEALSIIQDYRILRTEFGYDKKIVNELYLPSTKCTAVNVNKMRKMLYLIFDNLPSATVREIFSKIRNQVFKGKTFKVPHERNNFYFELYLLYLEGLDFISQNNVKKLAGIFKELGMYKVEDDLKDFAVNKVVRVSTMEEQNFEKEKKLFVNVTKNKTCTKPFMQLDNTNKTSLTSESSSLASSSMSTPSMLPGSYQMNPSTPGIALIISNEYFFTEIHEEYQHLLPTNSRTLQRREGTETDEKYLVDTFKRLNFNNDSIIVKRDRRHYDIRQDVKDAANKVTKEHSSLFVTILSHGEKEILYGSNSCRIEIQEIQEIIATTNVACLEGKPKILILQCCQGSKCQTLQENDENDYETDGPTEPINRKTCLPKSVDQFVFSATVPGYVAIRHRTRGTWFIQTLCQVLQENSDSKHFEEMCTEVVLKVSSKKWTTKDQDRCMVPLKSSTLRMCFYLPPKILNKNAEF